MSASEKKSVPFTKKKKLKQHVSTSDNFSYFFIFFLTYQGLTVYGFTAVMTSV